MLKFLSAASIGLLVSLTVISGSANAAGVGEIKIPNNTNGDIAAGQAKAATCAACHGANGISAIPANPNLAGQVPGFIADQLAAFKSGERKNAVMMGMAAPLSEKDMKDIDAYYASLESAKGSISEADKELALEGEKIYRGGYAEQNVAACMGCHSPTGKGMAKRYPAVAGQHAQYLEAQLLAFKKGERKGYNEIMSDLAFNLSESQIKALAIYMSGLQ